MEKSLKLSCSVYCLASLLFGLLSIAPTEVQRTLASLCCSENSNSSPKQIGSAAAVYGNLPTNVNSSGW